MAGYYDRDRRARYPDGSPNFDANYIPTAGTMNHAYTHYNNANEYIASGVPFVYTSAQFDATAGQAGTVIEKTINFPMVTRWVMVNVYDGADPSSLVNTAQVGFSLVDDGCSGTTDTCSVSAYLCARQRLEIKCNQICVHIPANASASAQIEVIAGLTGVRGTDFPDQDTQYVAGVTSKNKDGTTTDSAGTVSQTTFNLIQ